MASYGRVKKKRVKVSLFNPLNSMKGFSLMFLIGLVPKCNTLQCQHHFLVMDILPRHWTCVPLQSPFDIHSRTREPTNVYPVLQEKMAVAPYTVSVPILLPFGGVPRSPQVMTEMTKMMLQSNTVKIQSAMLISFVLENLLLFFIHLFWLENVSYCQLMFLS